MGVVINTKVLAPCLFIVPVRSPSKQKVQVWAPVASSYMYVLVMAIAAEFEGRE